MGESLTSGALRSVILMHGVPSIFEAFATGRGKFLTIPHTVAADPTTKLKSLAIPKATKQAAEKGAVIKAADETVAAAVVDLGERKKDPSSYGVVFTKEPDNGECWHCRRQVKPERKVGIVLRTRDDRFHHLLIVDIEGRACDLRCALKFIKDHVGEHICYEGREAALRQINEICNPGTRLIPAQDWRLLEKNQGPFSDEKFDAEVRSFVPTPSLHFRLCSLQFAPA